jgi:hypothetical protein
MKLKVGRTYKAALILQGEGAAEHWTCLLTMNGTGYAGQGRTLPEGLKDLAKNIEARDRIRETHNHLQTKRD